MYIEELKEEDLGCGDWQLLSANDCCKDAIVVSDAKRLLVGAGARALFYPTLLYNVVRNKVESEFRWWDRVDEVHAIKYETFGTALIRRLTSPFIVYNDSDVLRLKELGVCGVVTLNESYETLVPTSLYHAHDIEHLVIPTRDYLFAPSYGDICEAVEFIHNNASSGKTTYVHCKAGRGRSTTIVLCYLVEHRQMSPDAAYEYVRAIRPRVRLASSQWQAVQGYYLHRVKKTEGVVFTNNSVKLCPRNFEPEAFNEESLVLVAESDLEGYDESFDSSLVGNNMLAELSLPCRAQLASQAAITRLSGLWLGSHAGQKLSSKKLITTEQLGNVGVDIRVY